MHLVNAIWTFLLGVLAASGAIIARKPDAKQLIDKLAPYQGWMGLVSGIWGIWATINTILNMRLLGLGIMAAIFWVLLLADSLLNIALGSILGTALAKTYVKDPKAQEKMDQLYNKLSPFRNTLGFAGIALAIVTIIFNFLW